MHMAAPSLETREIARSCGRFQRDATGFTRSF